MGAVIGRMLIKALLKKAFLERIVPIFIEKLFDRIEKEFRKK